jgi:hypothetical protein
MSYRVIQWATGAMGKTCLRAVIDHPDLELAGVYVYGEKKAGRDAGEIARRAPTGIIATRSIEEILDIDADVLIHAPRIQVPYTAHKGEICRLLASGKNLITINGHSFPAHHGHSYVEEFEEACRQGNSSLFGTGLNPGFAVEKIAAIASGICTEVDSIFVREVYNCQEMPGHDYVFNVMGMGSDPDKLDLGAGPLAALFTGLFTESIGYLAHRLGVKLDDIEADHEVIATPVDIEAVAGVVPAGTVAATNWRWHGIVAGKRFFTLSINWIMDENLPGYEGFRHWTIEMRGKPGLDISMDLVEPEDTSVRTRAVQFGVTGSVINSIPEVCAAEPGILDFPLFAPFRQRF